MKKGIVLLLVAFMVCGAVFAAQGDIKAGLGLGYAGEFWPISGEGQKGLFSFAAFNISAYGEYDITDAVSARLDVGLMLPGRLECSSGGYSESTAGNYPVQFSIYLGGLYNYEISKDFVVGAGAGFFVQFGKLVEELTDEFGEESNTSLGLGLDVVGRYHLNPAIDIILGGRFRWILSDTNTYFKYARSYMNMTKTGLNVTAGVTYKI